MSTKSLKALLDEQLNEILVTEILILDVLPTIEEKISGVKLSRSIRALRRLTRNQSRVLQRILRQLEVPMEKVRPEEFETLIAEIICLTEYSCNPEIVDVNIANGLNRLNSFQSACYGAASIYAKTLGYQKVAVALQQLINEKKTYHKRITQTAESQVDRAKDN